MPKGFEGEIFDVSIWNDNMEGWKKHRSNLLTDFGCSWNDPEGKKLVAFEQKIIAGGKVYGTVDVSFSFFMPNL
jgi:hypothetical protein